MKRRKFVAAALFGVALSETLAQEVAAATPGAKRIAGVAIPDSTVARDAAEAARSAENDALFNHSLRSFLFAELIAEARNVQHDSELVAAILHDIGLTPAHATAHRRFEVDGAECRRDHGCRRSVCVVNQQRRYPEPFSRRTPNRIQPRFLAQLADYAKRKPDTVANTFIEDVAVRTNPAYHPANFYDAIASADAFASLGL